MGIAQVEWNVDESRADLAAGGNAQNDARNVPVGTRNVEEDSQHQQRRHVQALTRACNGRSVDAAHASTVASTAPNTICAESSV